MRQTTALILRDRDCAETLAYAIEHYGNQQAAILSAPYPKAGLDAREYNFFVIERSLLPLTWKEGRAPLHKLIMGAESDEAAEENTTHLATPLCLRDFLVLWRRSMRHAMPGQLCLPNGAELHVAARQLSTADNSTRVSLTEKEIALLVCLHQNPRGCTKETLLEDIWGYADGVDTHTLETHLSRLRRKLQENNGMCEIIWQEGKYCLK